MSLMVDVKFNTKDAEKKLKKLSTNAYPDAIRDSLNGMAKGAGTHARSKSLKKFFNIRNKWTKGSIVPQSGKPWGLIPSSKKNINKMFSQFGSRQPYLLEQEKSFKRKEPAISVSKWSRKGGSFPENIKPSLRMKKIKNKIKTYRDVRSTARTRKGKTFAMLSMLQRRGYRGFYFLNVPGTFPRGIYKNRTNRIPKRKNSFNRVTRIRSQEKGTKKYKSKKWFSNTMKVFEKESTYNFYWKKAVKKQIDPVFKRNIK